MECIWIVEIFIAGNFCGGFFYRKIAAQINGEAGELFSL